MKKRKQTRGEERARGGDNVKEKNKLMKKKTKKQDKGSQQRTESAGRPD
jgi:hypothetical protein